LSFTILEPGQIAGLMALRNVSLEGLQALLLSNDSKETFVDWIGLTTALIID